MEINILKICFILTLPALVFCIRKYSPARKAKLREEVRGMFQHAYEGYLRHASDYDELRPLTCDGINTWGSYSLTLIDALDTLAVMGNYTEYRRVAEYIIKNMNFDNDINVSVFETNIRIVGGLLSAHLMAHKAGMNLEPGWPCNGPLLRLAEDVAKRLLPAFNSKTGMPYGTVNLRHGVPPSETSVTCTAGVGTFIVEFGTLSRLTGDPIYEEVAFNAIYSLWNHRSNIGLLGNHIDVQTGRWTAQDAGIGAGVDSFFEYLVKGAILLNRPDLLEIFHEGRNKIDRYMKRDDWYVWVGMNKGQVTLPVFQSLEAYWPGVLSLVGDIGPAMKILHNYHTVWRQYGFLPEFYNIPGAEAGANRESYPLRPELAESAMYLYRATKDPYLLEIGEDMLRSIGYSAKTACGYATIRNVRDHRRDNRMESFFLSETTKYLYLLFDEDNFLHNNGGEGRLFETPNGMCVIEAGGYIFNTEAHPIDPSALHCCYDLPQRDIFQDFNLADYHSDILMQKDRQSREEQNSEKYVCPHSKMTLDTKRIDTNLSIDIEVLDTNESVIDLAKEMLENFYKIQDEKIDQKQINSFFIKDLLDSVNSVSIVDEMPTVLLNFMKNHKGDPEIIDNLSELKSHTDLPKTWSIWSIYMEKQRLRANVAVIEAMGLHKFDKDENETYAMLSDILEIFNSTEQHLHKLNGSSILRNLTLAQIGYTAQMVNASAMFDFTLLFAKDNNKTNANASYDSELKATKEKFSVITTPSVHFPTSIDLELFERIYRIVKFKKRMIDTFDKLQNLMENNETQALKSTTSSKEPNLSDVGLDSQNPSKSESTEGENDRTSKTPPNGIFNEKPISASDEPTNKSFLTEFVHSIIKSTLPPKPKFDEQFFLRKIRSQGIYMNKTQNYQLLTCKAHKFAERFAYRYEVV